MAKEYTIEGVPVVDVDAFTEADYLLGADEGQNPAIFSKNAVTTSIYNYFLEQQKDAPHIGKMQDGDLVMGLRAGQPVIYTYEAIIGAKPTGIGYSAVSLTDKGASVLVKATLTDREGNQMQWRIKYVGGQFNEWSDPSPSGVITLDHLISPVPVGAQTIEIEAKDAFITTPVVYRANVNVTTAGNGDVTLTMTAADGEEVSAVTATITDASGDPVYWRGKHDLGGFTDWQGPFTSPHSLTWTPAVPGGTRVITLQAKSQDAAPYPEESRTVTITETPLLPGQFKLIDGNAAHDRNVEFVKTIRFNASADVTQVKLIARKHTGEWIYNGAWFVKQGEHTIGIPVTLPYTVGATDPQDGTAYFWKVVMEGSSIEYEFPISTVAPSNIQPSVASYGTPDHGWNFGTGGNVTNEAQLTNSFEWGMFHGVNDPHHTKNNETEWQNFTAFSSSNYRFDSDSLALIPINAVAPNAPVKDDITSGSIRSIATIDFAANKSFYIEAMIDLPRGKGFWPAFWLYSTPGNRGNSEIDIFEFVGSVDELNDNREFTDLHTNLHQHGAVAPRMNHVQYGSTVPGMDPSPSNGFNKYALEVDGPEKRLRYYYNDRMIRNSSYDPNITGGKGWTPAGPAEVIINLAIGGSWPGPADNAADYDTLGEMRVDYLNIYSKIG